jgi:hypothetical protein
VLIAEEASHRPAGWTRIVLPCTVTKGGEIVGQLRAAEKSNVTVNEPPTAGIAGENVRSLPVHELQGGRVLTMEPEAAGPIPASAKEGPMKSIAAVMTIAEALRECIVASLPQIETPNVK